MKQITRIKAEITLYDPETDNKITYDSGTDSWGGEMKVSGNIPITELRELLALIGGLKSHINKNHYDKISKFEASF